MKKTLATLTEDELHIYAKGTDFSYVFSKHYGAFESMIVHGKEQLAGRMRLSAFRAPTDNDCHVKVFWSNENIWQGENLDCAFEKVYDCRIENGIIVVESSLSGVSRKPVSKHRLTVTIDEAGSIDFHLKADIRKNAHWLPRFGYEVELPRTANEFDYYGFGPWENYCDMRHGSTVGMYHSSTETEYVNYVRPQEHGNHSHVKWLRIGELEILSEQGMEINVSDYSVQELYKAKHTDELKKDGKVHLRLDYKVSGIGSNSCGPQLAEQYRLQEKEIDFSFCMNVLHSR